MGELMCGGLYERRFIHGITQVLRERWAYLRESLYAGVGLIGGEIRYVNNKNTTHGRETASFFQFSGHNL